MGLLALARGFPRWLRGAAPARVGPAARAGPLPRDLRGQTVLVLGLGRIGAEIARLARVLGLQVIGVRRGPRRSEDPVDELHPPQALPELLAARDWLVLACPLTPETRGLIDAAAIAAPAARARASSTSRAARSSTSRR